MRVVFGLATVAVGLLMACGGGQSVGLSAPPVDAVPIPGPQAPASASQGAPAAALWSEDWRRPLAPRLGGRVVHTVLDCQGRTADPERPAPSSFAAGYEWAPFPAVVRGVTWEPGRLLIDDLQRPGEGWALLAHWTTPPDRPVRLTGVLELQPDRGAWLGMALIADESDYRALAMRWHGAELWAYLYAPCYAQPLARLEPGPRSLALDYTPPPAPDCWRYRVDGQLLHTESCAHAGAPLQGPARPGIYAVNVEAEAGLLDAGRVRASVGPIQVQQQQGP